MNINKNIVIIYTLVGSLEDAESLANQAVKDKYAACVNIIPSIKSIYMWNESIANETECGMIFKTTLDNLRPLEEWILAQHPYEVPAIIKLSGETSQPFFNYLLKNVR